MSIETFNVMNIRGDKDISCSIKYPISPDSFLELKGEFRSSGKIKSHLWFGLNCFRENGKEIESFEIYRINEPLIITSVSSDGKSFSLIKKPEKQINSDEKNDYDKSYRKYLGFYFDGNINRLPDYVIKSPAYKIFTDNNIYLNNEIPKEIIGKIKLYETKVMNQFGNSTYDYSAANNAEVPEHWTLFKAEYHGFSGIEGDLKGKFRLETKSVSPIILCNHYQSEDAILEIKNVEIYLKDKPNFK